jgi:uncharacterized protein YxeA
MKKIIISFLLFLLSINSGFCALKSNELNVLNLKENNMYILSLKSKALNIDKNQNKFIDIYPINSIENDGKELFIEAKSSGVYDVDLKTEKNDYKLRIIAGTTFEELNEDITLIDLPIKTEEK